MDSLTVAVTGVENDCPMMFRNDVESIRTMIGYNTMTSLKLVDFFCRAASKIPTVSITFCHNGSQGVPIGTGHTPVKHMG